MDEMTWEILTEIQGRLEADILKSFLEAEGVPVELIQEGAGSVYPVTFGELGRVQIFVPKEKMEDARALLEAYESGEMEMEIADEEFNEEDEGEINQP